MIEKNGVFVKEYIGVNPLEDFHYDLIIDLGQGMERNLMRRVQFI